MGSVAALWSQAAFEVIGAGEHGAAGQTPSTAKDDLRLGLDTLGNLDTGIERVESRCQT